MSTRHKNLKSMIEESYLDDYDDDYDPEVAPKKNHDDDYDDYGEEAR